jgi:hypothetical protein
MIFESDVTDIWADPALPSWSSRYAVGQDRPGGLTWPRIEGERNGQPYWYSVAQPHVTRDRIAVCPTLAGGNLTTANGKSGMVQAVGDAFYEMPYTCGEDTDIVKGNIDDPSKYHGWNQVAAIDIPKSTGTKITAARGGIVYEFEESLDCNGDCGGNYIIIRHQDGSYGVYYHLVQDGVLVTDGQLVRRGQSIAKTGNTGKSVASRTSSQPRSRPRLEGRSLAPGRWSTAASRPATCRGSATTSTRRASGPTRRDRGAAVGRAHLPTIVHRRALVRVTGAAGVAPPAELAVADLSLDVVGFVPALRRPRCGCRRRWLIGDRHRWRPRPAARRRAARW